VISAALTFLNRNSASVLITAAAFSLFGLWVSIPQDVYRGSTLDHLYERYVAKEEIRPRVFETGISVRLNREAPPVAALEEALREEPWTKIEKNPSIGIPGIALRAGSSQAAIAQRILASNKATWDQISDSLPQAPIVQAVRTVHSTSSREDASLKMASNTRVLKVPPDFMTQPESTEPHPITLSKSKTGLTRDQLLAAIFLPMAKNHVHQEKSNKNIFKPEISLAHNSISSAGTKIVSAPAQANADASLMEADSTRRRPVLATALRDEVSASSAAIAPSGHQIMIRGNIELSGGLALTHAQDRIAVVREARGQFVESGAVWIREARYEIFVESLEGHLVAEVRSPQGEVVGRGQLALSTVVTSDERKTIDGISLRVQPVSTGFSGRVQSAYSSSSTGTSSAAHSISKGIRGAKVEFQQTPVETRTVSGGIFEVSKFAEGSRVQATVRAKDHWPTMVGLTTGSEPIVPVFSNRMMEAFVSLTAPPEMKQGDLQNLRETKGVVWGRVVRGSQPVAGATIEVLTEGIGEPVYFNDLMLPDASLKATGSLGLFAVPAASEGMHAIQVHLGTRMSDPVYFETKPKAVFNLELDVLKASEVESRIYDAFRPDQNLSAELRVFGHAKARKIQIDTNNNAGKVAPIKFAHLGTPTIIDVSAGAEYLAVRVTRNPESRFFDVPLVPRAWYDRVVASVRHNAPHMTGNVIGFVEGMRYRVMIEEESLSGPAKVVYFDARGEIVSNEYGVAGGGFLLLGLKEGMRTVLIEAEGSDRVYAATVLVQNGVPALVSHWLR
jgi:hypothetical protein